MGSRQCDAVLPLQDGRAGVEMGEDGQPYICLRMLWQSLSVHWKMLSCNKEENSKG